MQICNKRQTEDTKISLGTNNKDGECHILEEKDDS